MNKKFLSFLLLLVFLPSALYAGESIKCASTTSTRNSGLLEYLLPIYKADSGVDVQIIAVGTGAALKLGQKGDVDCVLVHAEDLEKQLVEEGYFVDREEVMYNDFVILGPSSDPAGVTETGQPTKCPTEMISGISPLVRGWQRPFALPRKNRPIHYQIAVPGSPCRIRQSLLFP
jgi:tungstate transport system substrate-binding protein